MSLVKKNYKLVFLGDTAVGKTCLSNRLVNNTFYEFQEPTIGAAFLSYKIEKNDCIIKLDMWDTAGQERYKSLAPMYYRGAAGAIIVYDITSEGVLKIESIFKFPLTLSIERFSSIKSKSPFFGLCFLSQ